VLDAVINGLIFTLLILLNYLIMTRYNSSPEDLHFRAIENNYYKELDDWNSYEVALEQFARGELSEKPEQPFLVMVRA